MSSHKTERGGGGGRPWARGDNGDNGADQ